MRRLFFSSFRSVRFSVLASPTPGFFPVFFFRLSLQQEAEERVGGTGIDSRQRHQAAAAGGGGSVHRSMAAGPQAPALRSWHFRAAVQGGGEAVGA